MKHTLLLASLLLCSTSLPAADTFSFDSTSPGQLDVRQGSRIVARFMHAHDTSTPARLHDTYKPYLHLFDADGTAPITKGPGGDFTHHRGIYIGWSKIAFNGKTYDRWHMKGGEQVHQKFTAQQAGADGATLTALIHWNDEAGKEFLVEERTMAFHAASAPGHALVDFSSKLTAPRGDVRMDGDPEHAGIHFRPAQAVQRAKTTYVYPRENANAHKDTDYPWVGEAFTVGGREHSVVMMSHPGNPSGTRWSAYRDYGRFGAFPTNTIRAGESFTFRYRFLIAAGAMPAAEAIQKRHNEFTGLTAPVPKISVLPAEQPKPAAKKPAPAVRK